MLKWVEQLQFMKIEFVSPRLQRHLLTDMSFEGTRIWGEGGWGSLFDIVSVTRIEKTDQEGQLTLISFFLMFQSYS